MHVLNVVLNYNILGVAFRVHRVAGLSAAKIEVVQMKYNVRFFKIIGDYHELIHTVQTDTKPYIPTVNEYIYFEDLTSYQVSSIHTYYHEDKTYIDVMLNQIEV